MAMADGSVALKVFRKGAKSVGAVWFAVIGLYVISGLISPAMFQWSQFLNILQVASFLGVVALGQTFVVLTGGIDLSQAGIVTLTNIVATSLMLGLDQNIAPAIAACIAIALLAGIINGLLIIVIGITPLIATLGTNSILFGAALVYTGGAPRGEASPAFELLGTGGIAGVPIPTLTWLVLGLAMTWICSATVFGRWIYAVGANSQAAALAGVPVERVTVAAYAMSSLLACAGGLLLTAYIGSPSLGIGNPFLFTAIAAVVVGGAALTGGVGSMIATIGGAVFITELNSFTNIIRVSSGTQFLVQGFIIIASVLIYRRLSDTRR